MNRRVLLIIALLLLAGALLWQRCPSRAPKTAAKAPAAEKGPIPPASAPETRAGVGFSPSGPPASRPVKPEGTASEGQPAVHKKKRDVIVTEKTVPHESLKEAEKTSQEASRRERTASFVPPPSVALPAFTLKVVRAQRTGDQVWARFFLVDDKGQPVQQMVAKDFFVREFSGGKTIEIPRSDITLLPQGSREPASIVLVLDYSDSMQGRTGDLEYAVEHFIELLGGYDKVLIMKFAKKISIVTDGFTSDKASLKIALKSRPDIGYATSLYQALDEAVVEVSAQDAPRVVVAFTDGDDTSSPPKATSWRAISHAQKKDVQIFTIGLGRDVVADTLRTIAERTQGVFSYAPEPQDLYGIYEKIATILSKTPVLLWPTHTPGLNFEITFSKPEGNASYRFPSAD